MKCDDMAPHKLVWGAPMRNREPIFSVLARVFPGQGEFLEIASGTGQHGNFFCAQCPHWLWQATDIDSENLSSIRAYQMEHDNFLEPIFLDVSEPTWPNTFSGRVFDGIFCANMIHIAPIEAMLGLFEQAKQVLADGASLVLYGPFQEDGAHTSDSNARFHESLLSRDSSWGVRDVGAVKSAASSGGLALVEKALMPANNQCLIFRSEG